MKKIFTYAFAAIALGLTIILVPLIAGAEMRNDSQLGFPASLSEGFRKLEGPSAQADLPRFSATDIEAISICFVFALVLYMWAKSKQPHREYRWTGYVPY